MKFDELICGDYFYFDKYKNHIFLKGEKDKTYLIQSNDLEISERLYNYRKEYECNYLTELEIIPNLCISNIYVNNKKEYFVKMDDNSGIFLNTDKVGLKSTDLFENSVRVKNKFKIKIEN